MPATEFVKFADLKFIRYHERLPASLAHRASLLYPLVGRHISMTLETWLDGFCHDAHPDREIAIWERIALAFGRFSREHPKRVATDDAAKSVVGLLLSAGSGNDITDKPFGRAITSCIRNPMKGAGK